MTIPKAFSPQFTVNLAVDFVGLTSAAGGGGTYKTLENAAGNSEFQNGDNFSILSTGFVLPDCFTIYKDTSNTTPLIYSAIILKGKTTGAGYTIDVLGFGSGINVPMENFELALDVFCDCKKQKAYTAPNLWLNENFYLQNFPISQRISMLGIPSAYNGKTFYCSPFFKILHNFPLTN